MSIILPALIRVAFITLLERKILGLSQYRKGPNKVRFAGILQPIADAVKLFLKEFTLLREGNAIIFFFAPCCAIFFMLIMIINLPIGTHVGVVQRTIFILAIMRLGIYPLFLSGWRSNSKYSLLGSIRGVSQTISYEIALALLLFVLLISSEKPFNLGISENHGCIAAVFFAPVLILLFISCIAETNRTPFDFSEGERELVSGFNTEYGGGPFALIFISEYGIIVFFCLFLSFIVTRKVFYSFIFTAVYMIFLVLWIWLRTTFPRYRYDKLLNLAWKRFLPWSITFVWYYFVISIFSYLSS